MTTANTEAEIWRVGRSQALRIKIASGLYIKAFDFKIEKCDLNLESFVIKSSKPMHHVIMHPYMIDWCKELYELQQNYPNENL